MPSSRVGRPPKARLVRPFVEVVVHGEPFAFRLLPDKTVRQVRGRANVFSPEYNRAHDIASAYIESLGPKDFR